MSCAIAIAPIGSDIAGSPAVSSVSKNADGLAIAMAGGTLRLWPVARKAVRVTFILEDSFSARESLVVVKPPDRDVEWTVEETEDAVRLVMDEITVEVDRVSGALVFKDSSGEVLLAEPTRDSREVKPVQVSGEDAYEIRQSFNFAAGEALYGLGQFEDGHLNSRGQDILLVQTNTIAVNPFLVSTRGYGILWDNYSKTVFNDEQGATDRPSTGYLWSEMADGIDYYFIVGPELDKVVAGYRELTGRAPMFGKWAFGYWQSKERYKSFDELIDVVSEYRKREIPIDNIVQDWMYWGNLGWSPLEFDTSGPYKDPEKRIREIHDLNAHLMISIWPLVSVKSDAFKELEQGGHLFPIKPSYYYLPGKYKFNGLVYDAYSEEAREIYWKYAKKGFVDKGMDAFWMDGTEPDFIQATESPMDIEKSFKKIGKCELGSLPRYLNAYSLMTTQGIYEGWRRDVDGKRLFILTRSSFAGQQRHAAVTWSGDIAATWEVLHQQIPAGLNFCMAGIPYWTMDIGGFFTSAMLVRNKKHLNPDYRELYVRWFQYGAFCPIFRSHGTNTPREVWRFGEPGDETYDTLVKFDNLRYRLMPYIYSVAWMVTDQSYTMMRGLAMDFADDKEVFNTNDQFMFGPSILVNPVTKPLKEMGSPAREVYLPQSEGWFDFWTGQKHEGGQTIDAPAPLSTMPLYVKAGSIIPMGPFVQYATEKSDPIELRVYPGADCEFTLYEDEGDNYNYENGHYSRIKIKWNDAEKKLTIFDRQGNFAGMPEEHAFNIVIVNMGRGVGLEPEPKPNRSIRYDGTQTVLSFSNAGLRD